LVSGGRSTEVHEKRYKKREKWREKIRKKKREEKREKYETGINEMTDGGKIQENGREIPKNKMIKIREKRETNRKKREK
jgi:hypothetical protein